MRTSTFAVTGLGHGSLTYDAKVNHDPDGDGTMITVSKPLPSVLLIPGSGTISAAPRW